MERFDRLRAAGLLPVAQVLRQEHLEDALIEMEDAEPNRRRELAAQIAAHDAHVLNLVRCLQQSD
jgi:hypothetical protein